MAIDKGDAGDRLLALGAGFPLIPQPLLPQGEKGSKETTSHFQSPSPILGYRVYTSPLYTI